ncbi:MAG: hypothetical protein JWN84_3676 [Nocardioides sp.]|jgi:endonuclease/exonuclease/phosphatase family metal-dependent hydrolase|nr:hypothetical protein [Nocardioides sp.]
MLRARVAAVLLVAASLTAGCSDDPPDDAPGPDRPTRTVPPRPPRLERTGPPVEVTVLQYNIQFADAGIDGVARDIRDSGAEVVLLNEIDDRRSTGGLKQAAYLAEELGMSYAYDGNGDVRDGVRGNAVLTSWDITYVRRYVLPRPEGTEQRGLMNVVVRDSDVQLDVWTTHLNPDVGTLEQARRARTIIGRPDCATVFAGDLNVRPYRNPPQIFREHLGDVWRYVGEGVGGTNRAGDRRIDYMYFRDLEPLTAVVAERGASDHRRLVATFRADPRDNC